MFAINAEVTKDCPKLKMLDVEVRAEFSIIMIKKFVTNHHTVHFYASPRRKLLSIGKHLDKKLGR